MRHDRPTVRTVLTVDLSDLLEDGAVGPRAEDHLFTVAGNLPGRALVQVDLGSARWCSLRFLGLLRDLLATADVVNVHGSCLPALASARRALLGDTPGPDAA